MPTNPKSNAHCAEDSDINCASSSKDYDVKVPLHGSIKRRASAQKTIIGAIAQDSE